MKIKPLTPADFAASLTLITTAFASAPHTDGNEANLVAALRQSPDYHADYDVGAFTDDGTLIGYALLSKATIQNDTQAWPVFVLAPLAVLPTDQNHGVGGALITYLEAQAGEDARRAISILGDPAYYGRFGYLPATDFKVQAPFAVESKYFLLRPMVKGGLTGVSGTLHYDPAFGLA